MGVVRLPKTVLSTSRVELKGQEPLLVRFQLFEGSVLVREFERSKLGDAGALQSSGAVRVGDALLEINNESVELSEYDSVLNALAFRDTDSITVLTFGRVGGALKKRFTDFLNNPTVYIDDIQEVEIRRSDGKVYTGRDFHTPSLVRFRTIVLLLLLAILVLYSLLNAYGVLSAESALAENEERDESTVVKIAEP